MKFLLIFSFIQMALSGALAASPAHKDFDAVFFENVNFKGIFYYPINASNLSISKKYFFNIGEYFVGRLRSNDCVNLPNIWQNRASSIIINKCIIVFTTPSCKSNKESQIFTKLTERYFDVNFSHPNRIPSYNFFGSWYAYIIFILNFESYLYLSRIVDIMRDIMGIGFNNRKK